MLSRKIAIQLLYHGHEVGVKACNLNTSVPQQQFAATAYLFIWIENSDKNFPDPPFNDSFGACNLRMGPASAWLQCRKERCARKYMIPELLFEEREFCVFARNQLSAKSLPNHHTIAGDNRSDFRRDLVSFALTTLRECYCSEH